MWLWPTHKFWTFTPIEWIAAVIWNIAERFKIKSFAPLAPYFFGVVVGCKGKRKS